MKIAASICSWLGGIITTIISFSNVNYLNNITGLEYQVVYLILSVSILLKIVILIWRAYSTRNGSKIGCGIATLLFVSLIGGILTLCIPEDELY